MGAKLREVAADELLGRSGKPSGLVHPKFYAQVKERLDKAEALVACATRFVFGEHQAIVFPGDGADGWRVYAMKPEGTFDRIIEGGLTQAKAIELAQKLHAEAMT